MAYENFMCNKDFHPGNIRNLKKAGKLKFYPNHELFYLIAKKLLLEKNYIICLLLVLVQMYEAEQRQKQEERRQEELRQQYIKEQEIYKSK